MECIAVPVEKPSCHVDILYIAQDVVLFNVPVTPQHFN